MTYTNGSWFIDDMVVYDSIEWARMVNNGWITVSVDGHGIATMARRKKA
jgi:hypothetical protein